VRLVRPVVGAVSLEGRGVRFGRGKGVKGLVIGVRHRALAWIKGFRYTCATSTHSNINFALLLTSLMTR
jgi:hypothetical protein